MQGWRNCCSQPRRDQRSVWAQAKGQSGICWVKSVSWEGMLMRSRDWRSSMARALWLSLSGHCAVLVNCWSWGSAVRRHSCPTYSCETARGWMSSSQVLFLAANSVWRQRATVDSLGSNLHLPMPSEPCMSVSLAAFARWSLKNSLFVYSGNFSPDYNVPRDWDFLWHHNCSRA